MTTDLHAGATVRGLAGISAVIAGVRDASVMEEDDEFGLMSRDFREVVYRLTVDGRDMGMHFLPEADFRREFGLPPVEDA